MIFVHEGEHAGEPYKYYGIHRVKYQDGVLRRSRYEYEPYGKTRKKLIKDLKKMLKDAKKCIKPLKIDEVPEIIL